MKTVYDAKILGLPKIEDPRGNLSIIEQLKQIPFEIKRTYWIYDVPGGKDRGGHAYKENEENDYIMDYEEFKRWTKDNTIQTVSSDARTSVKINEVDSQGMLKEGKSVFDCSLCELNKMHDPEGNLTYMYENVHVPFPINRVFYSYDIPGGEDRGAHAHKECHQFIIAASGAFEVVLDDGINKRTVQLNRPFWGLHVPPGIWASEQGFSSGSICLVLASHGYSEDDYIRNYDDFLKYVDEKKSKQ